MLLTDRCGLIKVNCTVPLTTKASLVHHLFRNKEQQPYHMVWILQKLSIFLKKLQGTEANNKEATIQTATGAHGRRGDMFSKALSIKISLWNYNNLCTGDI